MTSLITDFSATAIAGTNQGYTAYHAPRYAFVLKLLEQLGATNNSRILDIGRSELTRLVASRFGVQVDSLGFEQDYSSGEGRHFHFDLNRAQSQNDWRRDLPTYDFIVMAEVIEHLYTAPQLVLAFLRTLLAENGYLIVQTPNAASLTKRIKLVLGRNPYEMIRIDTTNPGHFREYTTRELERVAGLAGLRRERVSTAFYFDARYARHGDAGNFPQPVVGTLKNTFYPMLPARLREGMTMVLRRA
ncbi:MAG TPA: methyltransferase domain-containing protein [Gemmatimonadaceae bacterium]|jgi:SAM-dependent methyltransferase